MFLKIGRRKQMIPGKCIFPWQPKRMEMLSQSYVGLLESELQNNFMKRLKGNILSFFKQWQSYLPRTVSCQYESRTWKVYCLQWPQEGDQLWVECSKSWLLCLFWTSHPGLHWTHLFSLSIGETITAIIYTSDANDMICAVTSYQTNIILLIHIYQFYNFHCNIVSRTVLKV